MAPRKKTASDEVEAVVSEEALQGVKKYKFCVKEGLAFGQGTKAEAKGGEIVMLSIEEAVGFCFHTNPAFDTLESVDVPSAVIKKAHKLAG